MLAIFPHGLESNLLVPVFLGVLVNFALTEAWGWDFVGVVVPGYLSAVALVEPVVAVIVLVEAVVTWALARLIDTAATRVGLWYPVFGRDRFYFILVVSIFARLLVEAALPALLALGAASFPRLGDLRGETFGIGLVLAPLAANRFWRAGLRSGLFQLGVEVAAVRLLLAAVMVLTNYSLSGFELGFDRLALAFFASPLTQLALLVTAAIASDFNRRFGWDSHGILVPALLALVVTAPVKVVATMGEAAAIVGAMSALVRLPWFRYANLEGHRRVVGCFVIGFGIKLALAAVMGKTAPGYRVTDLFGFGYLLPALLAERVLARANLPLVLIPTAQTALIGMPLAAGLGVLIVWLSPATGAARVEIERPRFSTLAQAVAAHGPVLRGRGSDEVEALAGRLARGEATADTGDGFVVAGEAAVRGLVARPARGGATGCEVVVADPSDEGAAERAAAEAARTAACLVVARPGDARDAAVRALGEASSRARGGPFAAEDHAPGMLEGALRAAFARPRPAEAYHAPPSAAAVEEAAFRIERDRGDARLLATSLAPLGLAVRRAEHGSLLLEGPGWPSVVLGAAATAERITIVAPHAGEVGTAGVALLVLERVAGDAVIAGEENEARAASVLGVALARAAGARLLVVRGTTFPLGDVAVLAEPTPPAAWPAWMKTLEGAFLPRFLPARPAEAQLAELRAFPAGTSALPGAALLWLSPRARRALTAGDEPFGGPEYVELAAARGVPVVHARLDAWLAGAERGPGADVLARAERLARTGDPAMLVSRLLGATASIVVDDDRSLAGIAVASARGRAVALGGDRVEERAFVRSSPEVAVALERGARTLVAGDAP